MVDSQGIIFSEEFSRNVVILNRVRLGGDYCRELSSRFYYFYTGI